MGSGQAIGPWRVLDAREALPLHDRAATRAVEAEAQAGLPAHTLMQRAGLGVARLAMAVAPHARRVQVLAGPGNNGGDGLVAAWHLWQRGLDVQVCLLADPERLPDDAADAWRRARAAGVPIGPAWPDEPRPDLVIDALLGIGATRAPADAMADLIQRLDRRQVPVLAVDGPTGLDADTGVAALPCVRATWTLSLLTLKPGLFTASGRDHAGEVWFDDLQVPPREAGACAWLGAGAAAPAGGPGPRRHAHHKGSFGDVVVVGGADGMAGAADLAGEAALLAGAGRVYVSTLGTSRPTLRAELMAREQAWRADAAVLASQTIACGCGGGTPVADALPPLLAHAGRLLLDADGLNAVASDGALQQRLSARGRAGQPTVLTPHPLEAARLLGATRDEVQRDRLAAARRLTDRFHAVVVLKGSGTVVAAPGTPPWVNPTGNAALATPGSGDVLAGWMAGTWARLGGSPSGSTAVQTAFAAACHAVWLHGRAADEAVPRLGTGLPLPAGELASHMSRIRG